LWSVLLRSWFVGLRLWSVLLLGSSIVRWLGGWDVGERSWFVGLGLRSVLLLGSSVVGLLRLSISLRSRLGGVSVVSVRVIVRVIVRVVVMVSTIASFSLLLLDGWFGVVDLRGLVVGARSLGLDRGFDRSYRFGNNGFYGGHFNWFLFDGSGAARRHKGNNDEQC
jgi:hypothetical protein